MESIKIGITGCTGTLGTLMVKKLTKMGKFIFSCFAGDISVKSDVSSWIEDNKFDAIIHFAAVVETKEVENNIDKAVNVNVKGTENLIKSLIQIRSNAWFFFASTSHVYGFSEKPISETSETLPISKYGKTKLMAEKSLLKNNGKYEGGICIGRIFSFYHESQKKSFLYPVVKNRLLKHNIEEQFELYGAANIRDFLNAEEVVNLIINLMECRYTGVINIASGIPVTIEQFVKEKFNIPNLKIKNLSEDKNVLFADICKIKNLSRPQ